MPERPPPSRRPPSRMRIRPEDWTPSQWLGLALALAAGAATGWALAFHADRAASLLATLVAHYPLAALASTLLVFAGYGLLARARHLQREVEAIHAALAADEGILFVFRRGPGGRLRCAFRNPAAERLASQSFSRDPAHFGRALLDEVLADGEPRRAEDEIMTAAGRRTLRWEATPIRDGAGRIRHIALKGHDLTEARKDEGQLQLAAAVLAQTHDCVLVTDAHNRIVLVNQAFCDTTGYKREEVIGRAPSMLASGLHEPGFFRAMWESLNSRGVWQGEIWNRRKDGEFYAEALNISALRDDAGRITHYVGVFSDITAQKAQADRLQQLAHYDGLTRLPNRHLFRDRLAHAIDRAGRSHGRIGVMFLDLDGFKAVNDSAGHETGDRLLVEIARRLGACMRKADTVARLGGDEFTILVEPVIETHQVLAAAERVIDAVNRPVELGGERFHVGVSIGIAIYPEHAGSDKALLDCADQAMYQAKQQGKNRYMLYGPPDGGVSSPGATAPG